jgi:hypothetical protein
MRSARHLASRQTWGVVTNNRLQDRDNELAQSEVALNALAAGGSLVPLAAAAPEARGSAALVLSADRRNSTFLLTGAPVPAGDRVYEIWLLKDGTPTPAGTFRPEAGVTAVTVPISAEGFDTVAMTEEPAGGSALPTGPVLLAAAIAPQ